MIIYHIIFYKVLLNSIIRKNGRQKTSFMVNRTV